MFEVSTEHGIILNAVEWLALLAVVGLLVTIVKTLIGKQAKQLEQRLADGTKRMNDIEKNYISQFISVRKTITDGNEANIREMMSMEMRLKDFLNNNFVSDKICALRHEEIKRIIIEKEGGG